MAARVKSSEYLVKYVEAQLGRPYWRGTFGQHASAALLAYERKRFPDSYKAADFEAQANAGQKVHDCCGLVKAANFCENVEAEPCDYDSAFDLNPEMYYRQARVKGPIATFPKIRGYLVFDAGLTHVGVYVGDDTVVEARGHSYGVVKSSIRDRRWVHWGDDCKIDYSETPTPAPKEDDEVKYNDLKMVRRGDTGIEVKTIQANVGAAVDGEFGPKTEALVKDFQRTHSVDGKALEVDGIVGPCTWKAIIERWEK